MKIAIVGYGKMGKMIENLANEKGIKITARVDPNEPSADFKEIDKDSTKDADVCIDFTHPDVLVSNMEKYAELKKNVVVGTTGWYDKMKDVEDIVKKSGIGCIWSGNFSIGVNMYFRIIEAASKLVNNFDEYDIMGVEYHHNQKADSPSGTMKMIGDIILNNVSRKKKAVYDMMERKIDETEVHLASIRGGKILGIHEIVLDSPSDTITLSHSARTREGFGKGALMAAEFVNGKKGFFEINDMMDSVFGGK
ncbi:4-hydroxy-tetrahydrodipicolinate reductase [Candidatus Woesearchaeota archaeon]|nr:4-hydroxy-tetrahydrodipicolinate reductase [Candidatus Woesearchaeota archaeon]